MRTAVYGRVAAHTGSQAHTHTSACGTFSGVTGTSTRAVNQLPRAVCRWLPRPFPIPAHLLGESAAVVRVAEVHFLRLVLRNPTPPWTQHIEHTRQHNSRSKKIKPIQLGPPGLRGFAAHDRSDSLLMERPSAGTERRPAAGGTGTLEETLEETLAGPSAARDQIFRNPEAGPGPGPEPKARAGPRA